jgi:hypothetical protein
MTVLRFAAASSRDGAERGIDRHNRSVRYPPRRCPWLFCRCRSIARMACLAQRAIALRQLRALALLVRVGSSRQFLRSPRPLPHLRRILRLGPASLGGGRRHGRARHCSPAAPRLRRVTHRAQRSACRFPMTASAVQTANAVPAHTATRRGITDRTTTIRPTTTAFATQRPAAPYCM